MVRRPPIPAARRNESTPPHAESSIQRGGVGLGWVHVGHHTDRDRHFGWELCRRAAPAWLGPPLTSPDRKEKQGAKHPQDVSLLAPPSPGAGPPLSPSPANDEHYCLSESPTQPSKAHTRQERRRLGSFILPWRQSAWRLQADLGRTIRFIVPARRLEGSRSRSSFGRRRVCAGLAGGDTVCVSSTRVQEGDRDKTTRAGVVRTPDLVLNRAHKRAARRQLVKRTHSANMGRGPCAWT